MKICTQRASRGARLDFRFDPDAEIFQQTMHDQQQAVIGAPGDEMPGGAVPQAAQQHGDHQVAISLERPLAIAAKRDVEVVAQPGGEADVPAAPEITGIGREVGHAEVDRKIDAHQVGKPARDIGVARKIAVNLQGESIDPEQDVPAVILGGGVEDLIGDGRNVIGQHDLLEIAKQDQPDPLAQEIVGDDAFFLDLGQQIVAADNGAGQELGKETDKTRRNQSHPASA